MKEKDIKQMESDLREIEEIWSRVRPGRRLLGTNREGLVVLPVDDPESVLGKFESEHEADAYCKAPEHIDKLRTLVHALLQDRDEAIRAFKEISEEVEPAYNALSSEEPVDVASVLEVSRKLCHDILDTHQH